MVLETSYCKSASRLERDTTLCREGSSGAVKVVLLVKFQRVDNQHPMGVVLTVCSAFPGPNGETSSFQDFVSFSPISIHLLCLLICKL